MSADGSNQRRQAAALRREFDDAFTRPPRAPEPGRIELLAIRVGGDPHALKLAELAGLHADKPITWVPGPVPELRGVVSLRGTIVPIYDLRLLLGYPAGPPPRWIAIASATAVGLAFDHLDGHLVVAGGAIVAEPAGSPVRPHAREVVASPDGTRSVLLHVPSLVNQIADCALRARRQGEQ